MRRAYLIWAMRKVLHPVTMKLTLITVLVWKSTEYVSFSRVFANLPNVLDVRHEIAFMRSAVTQTELATLIILPLIAGFFAWIVVDIVHKRHAYL